MSGSQTSLDAILVQLGDFGKYQSYIFALVSIVVVFHSAVHVAFVFSAKDLEYRCEVPICENASNFQPDWLQNAVPFNSNNKASKCERYHMIKEDSAQPCAYTNFNRSQVEKCDNHVYKSPEITIVNDFGILCEDNLWKLTLVGTINNVGQFVGLPISGIVSDRYGRRMLLIMGMVCCAVAGIARSFAPSYTWFLILEFIDAAFGSGAYSCGFILGVELVGPSKRVLSGTIVSSFYAVGEVLIAGIAWAYKSWRPMIITVYSPILLFLALFWMMPESVRWLLAKGRVDEAKEIIKKAARVNGRHVSDEVLQKISFGDDQEVEHEPLLKVFKSSTLMIRFVNCCICWITCTFLFYGLTLNSVALAGDSYVEFILTSLVEIPGYFATYFIVERIGRRASLCGSYLLSGLACISFIFISKDSETLQLCIYLLGKFGATIAFTVCYIITSEIFPTSLRHSLMGACSMFGRIGSMLSPQVPLLVQIWTPLPLVLFGVTATVAGLISLHFPETLNVKLPDTIQEAELIGRSSETLPLK